MYTQYKCMYNIQLILYLNIERKPNIKAALIKIFIITMDLMTVCNIKCVPTALQSIFASFSWWFWFQRDSSLLNHKYIFYSHPCVPIFPSRLFWFGLLSLEIWDWLYSATQRSNWHLKNSAAPPLSRNHDPFAQDNPLTLMGAVSCGNYFLSTKPRLFTGEGVHLLYGWEVVPRTARGVNINAILFELSCHVS